MPDKPKARTAPRGKSGKLPPRSSPKTGAKATPGAKKAASARKSGKAIVLLSGGNPQIAKADGEAPVQAYIAAMPARSPASAKP